MYLSYFLYPVITDGYLCYFNPLAIVKSPAMKVKILQTFIQDCALNSFGYIPRSRIARSHMVILFFIFGGNYIWFSATVPSFICSNSVKAIPISPNCCQDLFFCSFDSGHFKKHEMKTNCDF